MSKTLPDHRADAGRLHRHRPGADRPHPQRPAHERRSRGSSWSAMRVSSSSASGRPALTLRSTRYARPRDVDWSAGAVPLVDLGNTDPAAFPPGVVSAKSGHAHRRDAVARDRFRQGRRGRCGDFRAAQQAGHVRRRLELSGRAQDVRASARPQRLFQRDERARQPVDVARHVACLAAPGARPDQRARRSAMPSCWRSRQ